MERVAGVAPRPTSKPAEDVEILAFGSDYRGMIYVTAGGGVVVAGVSSWAETREELEALVPAYSEWQRRVDRVIEYPL